MNRRGPIIAAGAGVLLAVLVAVGLIFPKMNQVKTVQHQVTTAQADSWMSDLMNRVTASRWWSQGGVVVLTWDESEDGDQIATIVVSSRLHHAVLSSRGDHYGTLRGLEEVYGVSLLGAAASPGHGDLRPLVAP